MAKIAFGDKVRQLREAAGMTQAQLAERLSSTVRTVSRLETGAQEPTWPIVQALADTFGVSCEEFRGLPLGAKNPAGRGRPKQA